MLVFILSCTLLTLLVIGSLWLSTRCRNEVDDQRLLTERSRRQQNIAIARERLAQLDSGPGRDEARLELESSLADDLGQPEDHTHSRYPVCHGRVSVRLMLIAVPVLAASLYLQLGDTTWLQQADLPTPEQIRNDPENSLAQLLGRLEQTLEEEPENPRGWALAGRTYMALGRYEDAETALAEASRLDPENPELLTAWADATLQVHDNRFTDNVAARVERALDLNPNHVNALWIAGMGKLSQGQNERGLVYLRRLRPLLDKQPEVQQQVDLIIGQASGGQATGSTTAARPSVTVSIDIKPALRANLDGDETVFAFARAVEGPGFPLAAVKLTVNELPATVVLDESSAMIAGQTLAGKKQVEVIARVSISGQPVAQPGDPTSDGILIQPAKGEKIAVMIDRISE